VNIELAEIFRKHQSEAQLLAWQGSDCVIRSFQSVEEASPGGLVFVASSKQIEQILVSRPAVVATSKKLAGYINLKHSSVLLCANVSLAHAVLRHYYDDRNIHDTQEWGRIHPSAVIHATAIVPEDAIIGPASVIGQNVCLGSRVVVLSGVVIEAGVTIGNDCVMHPRVVLGYDSELGNRVTIKSGAIIGAEGYGFARDEKGRHHRIPQTGKVVIGDDVVIGANCTIDRATYAKTSVGNGCKLDALCHIGHNVSLGENCMLVAQTGIAGSCVVGDRVLCSGQTGFLDHKHVVSDSVLVLRCGVTEDISEPGIYAGTPAQPFKEYKRNVVAGRRLAKLRQEFKALQRKISKHLAEDSA